MQPNRWANPIILLYPLVDKVLFMFRHKLKPNISIPFITFKCNLILESSSLYLNRASLFCENLISFSRVIGTEPCPLSEMASACFDCNICLEFAHEPVVTLCGHLYCWPCIYKWFHFQSTSLSSYEHPQCPVCKSPISHATVVPLYGRGEPKPRPDSKAPVVDMVIPPRPMACGTSTLMMEPPTQGQRLPYRNTYQNSGFYEEGEDSSPPVFGRGVSGGMDTDGLRFQPVAGMLGEMVYARVFGNSERLYAYPNTYGLAGSSSPRLRWQEMQADKSLNRISVFLLCCFLLCLTVF